MGDMENVDCEMLNSLELFQDAIDGYDNLEIVCSEEKDNKEVLVVENSRISENTEGHQTIVDVSEIFSKVRSKKSASDFARVIVNERNAIVCEGVTRIVGYYSRTHNWNKSKIGELRDRQNGSYGAPKFEKQHHEESCAVVNSL